MLSYWLLAQPLVFIPYMYIYSPYKLVSYQHEISCFIFEETLYSLEIGSHYVTLIVLKPTEICLPQSVGVKGAQHHAQPPPSCIFKLQSWPFLDPLKILFLDFLAERVKGGVSRLNNSNYKQSLM